MIATATAIVLLISAVGGGVWALGKPRFANEAWVVAEFTDRDLRYQQQREEQLDQRVRDLRYKEKKETNKEVKEILKEDIEKAKNQLEKTQEEIRELRKKK